MQNTRCQHKTIDPMWRIDARSIIHRIVWWMVDVGAPGNILQHGWQVEASRQLGVHRITLRRQVQIMVEKKILIEGAKRGEVMLNLDIFRKSADASKLRMAKIERRTGK